MFQSERTTCGELGNVTGFGGVQFEVPLVHCVCGENFFPLTCLLAF